MNKKETIELLNFIHTFYKDFEIREDIISAWYNIMCEYDFNDVKREVEKFMAEDRYQKQLPTAYMLIKGLPKVKEKVDVQDGVKIYCNICNRPFNSHEELDKHFDRCSSIRYVIKQSKKWFKKDIDKGFLWGLNDEEFEERYNKLLKYIMEHTEDENERKRIGFIFNPPSEQEAREFLKGN